MNACGIVIFSHMRSRISSPESGRAITLATTLRSVCNVRGTSENAEMIKERAMFFEQWYLQRNLLFLSHCALNESMTCSP